MAGEQQDLWTAGMEVVRALNERGFQAYAVGGCLRDRMLGRTIRDVDIATDAAPDQVTALFPLTVPTGLKHGTVTVLHDGRSFEVTTFRTESGYSDARRPDQVSFVKDIREDLARRDFTINAMAAGLDGEVIDPFGGRADLEARRLRCVGDASERFGEDALRMLRAVRFAAEFGFHPALSVWRAIRRHAPRLSQVAMERVGAEWDKMMAGADPDRACRLLLRSGLPAHAKEPLPPAVRQAANKQDGSRCLRDIPDTDARWIAFLVQAGAEADEARQLCRALRFSGRRESRIAAGVSFHGRVAAGEPDRERFVSAVLDLGRGAAEDWLLGRLQAAPFRQWLDELPLDSAAELAVRGDELAERLGRSPGPWVARMLRRLAEEAANGRLPNDKETLLREAARFDRTDGRNRH